MRPWWNENHRGICYPSSKFFRSNLNEDGQRLLKLKGVEAVSQSLLLLLPIRLRSLRIRFGICCALQSTRLPFMSPSLLISLPLNTCKGGCVLLLLRSSAGFGAALNRSFRNCSRSFWPITIGSWSVGKFIKMLNACLTEISNSRYKCIRTSWNLIIVTTTINSFRAGHTDDFTWHTTKNGIPKINGLENLLN